MDELEYKSIIEWSCHNFYYKDMLVQSKQACNSYPTNEYFKILLSLSYVLSGKTQEAMKETATLTNNPDLALPTLLIQSFAHRSNTNPDRTTLGQIDTKIREERRRSSPTSLSTSAMVLLLLRRYERAKEFSDRAYNSDPTDPRVSLVKGWVDIFSPADTDPALVNYFEPTLKQHGNHFNALLGTAKYKQYNGDYKSAISILNSLIVRSPKLCLPLIEKMSCQLAMKDWDQVIETSNRILAIESNNLDSIKSLSIVDLCRNGDRKSASRHVQLFFRNLLLAEPKNIDLFVTNIQLFSRMTGKDEEILSELSKVLEKMLQQNPTSGELMIEMGNVYINLGRIKEAENSYRNAIRIDESSFTALMGLARCQLFATSSDALDLARQQIDFLMEIQSGSISPELLLISGKISINDQKKTLEYYNTAASVLLKNCQHLPYGYEYLKTLNPDLCLEIIKERLTHSIPTESKEAYFILLEKLTESCPGFGSSLLMLSRAKMQNGHLQDALDTLKEFLDGIDSTDAQAHLLMAQILIRQGRYRSASQSLEVGLSHDFQIRDNPIYHLLLGIIKKENQDLERALLCYKEALSLIHDKSNNISQEIQISTSDKATLYLELIMAYSGIREFDKAFDLIGEAKQQLAGTNEESKIIIGHAELYLNIGELDKAVQYLTEILPGEPYYLQARVKLADIYLNHRRDRESFAKCYRDLVEHFPGSKTHSMLGDAYMSIQEPDRAIEAYERALRSNPLDKIPIASKMGKALVKTHRYAEAIDYYKEIIRQKDCQNLQLDLAQLFFKFKQYEKAETTLINELQENLNETDLQALQSRVEQLLMLAKVREKANNIKGALSTLKEAKENQIRYIQRVELSPNLIEQKQMVGEICLTMADYASSLRDYPQAIGYYKEALNHKPSDVKALLSLAKLYMQMNDLDRCAQSCSALLTADPDNESASVMMADLAFRKVDFETAAFHFRQLLMRKPTYWTALARLIEVCRRTGKMDDLDDWLKRAETAEPGYHYCAGLLDWRMGRLNSALRNFNLARRDPEWGQQAIYNMIEICLDPDDESSLTSELFNEESNDYQDSRTVALKTAYRLLEELNPKCSPQEKLTHRLLGNFFLLATRQKSNIDKALQDCTSLMNQESLRDHVGPALGLATAHILLKQTPRARNHLKRVCKNTWTFEDAEYLERCWLLLADISVQSNKYDLANDLLKRIIEHNATCVRAHELSGQIAEKDQNYREAAIRYGQAWKFGGQTKLTVGYKLAYNHFKSKSYADSIEVCNQVLKQNLDYPRIRKDILEKAINHIRT